MQHVTCTVRMYPCSWSCTAAYSWCKHRDFSSRSWVLFVRLSWNPFVRTSEGMFLKLLSCHIQCGLKLGLRGNIMWHMINSAPQSTCQLLKLVLGRIKVRDGRFAEALSRGLRPDLHCVLIWVGRLTTSRHTWRLHLQVGYYLFLASRGMCRAVRHVQTMKAAICRWTRAHKGKPHDQSCSWLIFIKMEMFYVMLNIWGYFLIIQQN